MEEFKPKSFWKKPEGKTGALFMIAIVGGLGFLIASSLSAIISWILGSGIIGLAATLMVLGAIIYMALDSKMRNLVWFMYKSAMRAITGLFVQIDPIGILKSYVDDLKENLRNMNKQISKLRGQMHKLQELIINNRKEIESNLTLASKAKNTDKRSVVILKSRKAGRLKESNMKLEDLYRKMEVLYRVLTRRYYRIQRS